MAANEGSSRVLTQFLGNILRGKDIQLVDGGAQKRCFIYIDDAIKALMKIIENKDGAADQRIFNIGFPEAELSVAELAEMMIDVVSEFPGYADVRKRVNLVKIDSGEYYGKGYQDMLVRVPSIEAIKSLGWAPSTDVRTAIRKTVEFYIDQFGPGSQKGTVEKELL
jgi:nucleoside-diphosphate-sugar epimerase